MYCSNCGNKIEEDEKFCGKCGQPVSNNIEVNNTTKPTYKNKIQPFDNTNNYCVCSNVRYILYNKIKQWKL